MQEMGRPEIDFRVEVEISVNVYMNIENFEVTANLYMVKIQKPVLLGTNHILLALL